MISQLQKITAITCLVLLVFASISVAEEAPANRRGGAGFRGGRGNTQGGNGQGGGYRGGAKAFPYKTTRVLVKIVN